MPLPVSSTPAKAPAAATQPASAPIAAVSAPAPAQVPDKVPAKAAPKVTAPLPATATSSPVAPIAAAGSFGVNVGLFAIEANAKIAREKLEAAQLPVRVDTLAMKRGPRIRVRVGPFATQAQADAAVTQIRALGLDALAYRE